MGDLLQPEHLYKEKYLRGDKIGSGGFGSVYIVTSGITGETLAAKHIKSRGRREKVKARLEVEILSGLDCPFIIKFVEAFECVGETVIVMEYLTGGELFERLVDEDSELSESDCCLYMKHILMGVEYLHHRNIVHLDIKPENIMCMDRGSKNLKIVDLGAALQLEPGKKVQNMVGTAEFMAPEVVNFDTISTYTDMWSVGVLCFVLLSGYSPFLDDTDSATLSNVTLAKYDFDYEEFDTISSDAKDFITRLLRKTPTRRMSASDCLKHAWLEEKKIRRKTCRINLGNLRKFLARRKVQNIARALGVINVLKENVKDREPYNDVDCQSLKSGRTHSSGYTTEERECESTTSNDHQELPYTETDDSFEEVEELPDEVLEDNVSDEEETDISYSVSKGEGIKDTILLIDKDLEARKTDECQEEDDFDEIEEQALQLPDTSATKRTDGLVGKYKRTATKATPGTVKNLINKFQNT